MRLPLLVVVCALVGCVAPAGGGAAEVPEPDAGIARSDAGARTSTPGEDSGPSGADAPLSELGRAVHDAVLASNPHESLVPLSATLALSNSAEPALVEGPEIFPRIAELIVEAEHDVDFATFVWEVGSDPSNVILDALVALEARLRAEGARTVPVRVRFLVHANRLAGVRDIAEPLVRAVDALGLDRQYVDVQVATRESWGLGAMHQKLVVIDGVVAHVGGANVEHVHGWEDGRVPWHDTAYVIRGEIAHALLLSFDDMWIEGRTWSCDATACDATMNRRPSRAHLVRAGEDGRIPMIALTRRPRGGINNEIDNAQDAGYLAAMRGAREVLKIESPNLNDDAAKGAILEALGRGVTVHVVLSLGFNETTESLPGQGGGNAANVDALYAQAASALGDAEACRLLQIRWYSRDGLTPIEGNGPGASHAKYMSIDGRLAIVGSANMDTQTWNHSGEVNVAVDDPDITADWDTAVFDPDFARGIATTHCP